MSNLNSLIEECRKQDEEMREVTTRIGNICDKIREDITQCSGPAECRGEEHAEHVVELPELKKAVL